jgi:hypothetical protein
LLVPTSMVMFQSFSNIPTNPGKKSNFSYAAPCKKWADKVFETTFILFCMLLHDLIL